MAQPDIHDWPDVRLVRVEVQIDAEWSGLRDVAPVFSRPPWTDWCFLFFDRCQKDPALEWFAAGFATCKPSDLDATQGAFSEITRCTNEQFRDFLARAAVNQREQVGDLIVLEGASEATGGEGYLCRYSFY